MILLYVDRARTSIRIIYHFLSVGYNDREMVLDGQFSYDNRNQRALPFNVIIEEIGGPLRTYYGSNSEF